MADAARLATAAGNPLPLPQALDIPAGGLPLQVLLPAGRKLERAAMQLSAASAVPAEMSPRPVLDSDGFSTGSGGAVNMSGAANAHWLSIGWDVERAIVGLTVTAAGATTSAPATGARVRMLSAGNWLPLPARDLLLFAAGKAGARFPACAASSLMLELQAENKVGGNFTGVLVPGAVDISNPVVSVLATPQPCHFSLAVADDAAFFSVPGPLPAQPQAVSGLLRALNRYLADHPGATAIPLTLRAAAPARLLLNAFDATLASPAAAPGPAPPAPPPPRQEQPGVQPAAPMQAVRGRWVRQRHVAAQAFVAPLPVGRGLSALEVWARPLGDGSPGGQVRGQLSLHADEAGRPAAQALAPAAPWQVSAGAGAGEMPWLRCELPLPAMQPPVPWWAMLQVDEGELLWYQAESPPPGAGAALVQVDGGPWMPVAPGGGTWLQSRLQLVELPQAR